MTSKTENRIPRSPAAAPKNIETYRRTFNSWHHEREEKCHSSNFPPVIPQRHLLVVNVSGKKYEIDLRRLNEHPETLLGDAKRREVYWDPCEREIFFDRHQKSFEAVHNYYMGLRCVSIFMNLEKSRSQINKYEKRTLKLLINKTKVMILFKNSSATLVVVPTICFINITGRAEQNFILLTLNSFLLV